MTHVTFDQRLSRIHAKHRRTAGRVSYQVGEDGLVVPVPQRRRGLRLPLASLILVLVMGYAFKTALFVGLGEGAYGTRLELLQTGGLVGQAAVWIMQPDAVVLTAAEIAAQADTALVPLL
jgi:hypothetical protein